MKIHSKKAQIQAKSQLFLIKVLNTDKCLATFQTERNLKSSMELATIQYPSQGFRGGKTGAN